MKKVIKKIFKPIYNRVYNRFVETVISELRQNKTAISEELSVSKESIKQYIADELNNNNTKLINEINQVINSVMYHSNSTIEWRISHLLREVRHYQEVAVVNTAAFAEYKNIFAGRDVVLVGTGPTLDKYTKPIENAVHIGLNTAYKSDVRLDFLFVTDAGFTKYTLGYLGKDIESYKCKKFFGISTNSIFRLNDIIDGGEFWKHIDPSESFCERANATRFYHETTDLIYPNICMNPTVSYGTVAIPAFQFALFTNPRRIYLVGLDSNTNGHFSKSGTEFPESRPKEVAIDALPINHKGFKRMKEFIQTFYPDTEIISINPVGLAGLYKDVITDNEGNITEENDISGNYGLWNLSDDEVRAYSEELYEKNKELTIQSIKSSVESY